jgi:hypothetical protein
MTKMIRVINPSAYLKMFKQGEYVRIGINVDDSNQEAVCKFGFSYPFVEGERVLPEATISKAAYENVEGKYLICRDLPKETLYRYFEWSWEDYAGTSYWDSKFIPYERYHREFIPPLALEISMCKDKAGNLFIVTDPLLIEDANFAKLKLAMNLFLSVFKSFKTFTDELQEPIQYFRKVHWEILRPGKHSKEEISRHINDVILKSPKGKQNMYRQNIEKLQEKCPEVIAIGTAGFSGYLVFYYPEKKLAILESLMPNNATYVLGKDWEDVSKLSKTQVLSENMHLDRILHCDSWNRRVEAYLA